MALYKHYKCHTYEMKTISHLMNWGKTSVSCSIKCMKDARRERRNPNCRNIAARKCCNVRTFEQHSTNVVLATNLFVETLPRMNFFLGTFSLHTEYYLAHRCQNQHWVPGVLTFLIGRYRFEEKRMVYFSPKELEVLKANGHALAVHLVPL